MEITWRWPHVEAETCRDVIEEEKGLQLISQYAQT
jgi:hypothetical protein